jgi:hypothetical protein
MAVEPRAGKRTAGMPGWVKTSLWLGGTLLLVVAVMLALGHGPGQHMNFH